MTFLETVLPYAEIGRINKLSQLIKSNWNILHNAKTNKPYNDSDLAADIQYSRNKFYNFMNKLYKLSVVYKLKGYIDRREQTVFLLNPHLAKNSKTINKELLVYFQDISKPEVQKKISSLIKDLK
jgi:DNA-binding MarR family transcriptional regulator